FATTVGFDCNGPFFLGWAFFTLDAIGSSSYDQWVKRAVINLLLNETILTQYRTISSSPW
ncbi:MAG TPA: hypothetical protein VLA60_08290, partial [Nitrospirales bacterium]|nr:hypothetical protein [Nitrospirales bacterium]